MSTPIRPTISLFAAGMIVQCVAAISVEPPERSVLRELMPIPVKVDCKDGFAEVSELQKIAVERAAVPGAPAATADEAYVLEIGSGGVKIVASGVRGERWARVTLDQLIRLCLGGGRMTNLPGGATGVRALPCCRITDWPRLKWRGFMLDTARNYLPVKGVKDVIDVMSRYKLNLFHWHLTENYAWRLESKRHPQLQSARAFLHRHKGMFYTQEEFREVVDYAYGRGICVMPEFDLPGHSLAFRRAFGFETMSASAVGETAASLFDELCTLAPREKMPFVHIGTDEVMDRETEAATREALDKMAAAIERHGRTVVSWIPGEKFNCAGNRVGMLWTDDVSPDTSPGAYFDAIGMYIEDFDPFELLSVAVYHKAARWHDAGERNYGAVFCAWHDGFTGLPYENLLRNQQVLPACVFFGNAYWRGRDTDQPELRKRLPYGGDATLLEATDIERRVIAQRDRVLCDIDHPFHFLRQTDMRWRMIAADGTILAKDIAQATISPARFRDSLGRPFASSNEVVVLETWIRSPVDRSTGAWIGFTNLSRDYGLFDSAPLPDTGEWNRFGASVELNGERISPPAWKRPGLKKGNPIADWMKPNPRPLYEVDEEPFVDQEYYMREPTRIQLRKGWNHVRLVVPNPAMRGSSSHRWTATFIPVEGTTSRPREVPGLVYSSAPHSTD